MATKELSMQVDMSRWRQILIVTTMCAVVGMIIANMVVSTITIPAIANALHASQSSIQWIGDIYALVLATLLLPCGALLDRFGRKKGLIWGLGILTVALVLSAYAPSADTLFATRAIAGAGAALAFPGTLATITSTMGQSGTDAVGYWALSTILGGILGYLMGGLLIQYFWWGSPYLVTAGLALLCLLATIVIAPETIDREHASFDPLGAVLSCVGVGALVFAITEEPIRGWADPLTLGGSVLAVVGLAAFVAWELRAARPLLEVRLFSDRVFGTSSAALFMLFLADYGLFFLCFQYESYVLGYDPLKSALGLIPSTAFLIPIAPLGPRLARRFGRRLVFAASFALCAAGYLIAATIGDHGNYWTFTISFAVFWSGVALCMGPCTEGIIEAMPPSKQGVASAVNDLGRELGAAVGIAVVGSAFNAGYRGRITVLFKTQTASVRHAAINSPATGLQASGGNRAAISLVRHGVLAGWRQATLLGTALMIGTCVFVAVRYPSRSRAVLRTEPDLDLGVVVEGVPST